MRSHIRILGHAAHPLMVTLPIGLGVGALAFDVISRMHRESDAWPKGAFVLLILTLLTGAVAAIVGLVDWAGIPAGTRAKRIGLIHGAANLLSLSLIMASTAMRWGEWHMESPAQIVSGLAILNFGFGGWLGGELVERLGLSVDPGAHLNAPSSLKTADATLSSQEPPPLLGTPPHPV